MFRIVLLSIQLLLVFRCDGNGITELCIDKLCDRNGAFSTCCNNTTCDLIKGYKDSIYQCRPNRNACKTTADCGTIPAFFISDKRFECVKSSGVKGPGKCGVCIKTGFACSSKLKCCGYCDLIGKCRQYLNLMDSLKQPKFS
jgi:hypothetical protein